MSDWIISGWTCESRTLVCESTVIMALHILCPECDTVFEPPAGVWTAHCPFCGHVSEVPHTISTLDSTKFRKRLRKTPGWITDLLNHMPPWGGRVLVFSFILCLISSLLQAWTSAHSDQSRIAMIRAVENLAKARSGTDSEELIKALDGTLSVWDSESSEQVASEAGLIRDQIRKERKTLIQRVWSEALEKLNRNETDPEKRLQALSNLADRATEDDDLIELKSAALQFWRDLRDLETDKALNLADQQKSNAKAVASLESLKRAYRWANENRPEMDRNVDRLFKIEKFARQLAEWRGVIVVPEMVRTTFTDLPAASGQILPTVSQNLRTRDYLMAEPEDKDFAKWFQESSGFQLRVGIDEHFGRPFEDTPHRTTIITVLLKFNRGDETLWSQQATGRTPRIPAKTAMGMSRLQLSSKSDEKIEKRLAEAAWESLPQALNQVMQLLPEAGKTAPSDAF